MAENPDSSVNSTNEDSLNTSSTTSTFRGVTRSLFGRKRQERAPLLSQRRLFRSLSGRELDNNEGNVSNSQRTLGTFIGVFAPVSLSQFSTVLFLRVGFIIGYLGLLAGSGTLLLAYVILMFTILSVCAISTNGAVEGGGAYYMISRTLGPEFGGAIGALFFFANVFSSALYVTGCVEGLIQNFGENSGVIANFLPDDQHIYGFGYRTALNVFNLLICMIGAGLFAKMTLFIFIVVLFCTGSVIISFLITYDPPLMITVPPNNEAYSNQTFAYSGFSLNTLNENLYPKLNNTVDYSSGAVVDYAMVFGVLFSGVTGIMAGANMSGELKSPSKNIPFGTVAATGFTFCIYLLLLFLSAGTTVPGLLQNNYGFMTQINVEPVFVCIGIITATLSASLSNLIGASRVLDALVKDKIFGKMTNWIDKLTYKNNPLGSVLVTGVMVECACVIRELNTIAPITSVFFLLSYLATNIACLGLDWASAPNFRPTFKYFSWWTALLGIIGNGAMMFVINPEYAGICFGICLILIIALHLRSPSELHQWGSISQALIFHQVRKYLLLLDQRKDHVKFWRPQMLLMVANPRSACPLIDFGNDLKKSGLYILGHVKVAEYDGFSADPAGEDHPKWMSLVDHLKVKAFVEVTVAETVRKGLHQLVRIAGLGAMKPNTILLGFHDNTPPEDFFSRESSPFRLYQNSDTPASTLHANCWQLEQRIENNDHITSEEFVKMIRDVLNMGKNICVCRHFHLLDKEELFKNSSKKKPYIDVWPINFFNPDDSTIFDTTSLFLMQLATVLNMVSSWKKRSQLRVFMCTSTRDANSDNQRRQVDKMLNELRISASVVPVQWDHVNSYLRQQDLTESVESTTSEANKDPYDLSKLSDSYLGAANHLILKESIDTAVTFIYLPRPPENQDFYPRYLHALTTLTQHLRPTILVHGVSAVTTTNL